MPAIRTSILPFLSIALSLIASGCEPRGAGEAELADTGGVEAETVSPDTGLVALIPGPNNEVTCASADSLELSDGAPGTLSLPPQSHGHELHVPSNTVPVGSRVTFTMRDVRATYVAVDVNVIGGPAPTPFNPRVTLRLSYAGCSAPDTANLRIYKRTGGTWNPVTGSTLDLSTESVTVELTEFSQYALGAG